MTPKRIRSSKTALENAIQAMAACGLSVRKVCITGGQYELHVGPVEQEPEPQNDKGLEQWN